MSGWHEEYKRRYAELKKGGKSFFPHAVFKDAVMAFLVLAALLFLSLRFGAGLEQIADPTDSTYNPRPEWYFMFLFQTLKLFPGNLEAVAAVILPGAVVGILLLVPFLDKGPERHPWDRPLWTGGALLFLAAIAYQTWAGLRSPLTNPILQKDPHAVAGERLYRALNCAYCHRVSGKGGTVGPALDRAAGRNSEEVLSSHFRDPQQASPGSAMPKLNLLDDEIVDLIAYLQSLGAEEPYTEEAPNLFVENCAACHKIGKEGSDLGPDLSLIGSARDKSYIRQYIADPNRMNPSATMPGYEGQLTDVQMEDLARYLAAQGR